MSQPGDVIHLSELSTHARAGIGDAGGVYEEDALRTVRGTGSGGSDGGGDSRGRAIRSEAPRTARGGRIGGFFGGLFGRIGSLVERAPPQIPLTPHIRQLANSTQVYTRQTVDILPIRLAANLKKGFVHIEPVELKKTYRLTLHVDCSARTKAKLVEGKDRVLACEHLEPGMRQALSFDLPFKAFPPPRRVYSVVLEPGDAPGKTGSPGGAAVQVTVLQVTPSGGEGALEARVKTQRLRYGRGEFEILDIYGQCAVPAEVEETVVRMKDLAGSSCVSISMAEQGETLRSDCVICLIYPRSTLLLPCRHMCICVSCAETLGSGDGKCPLCRQVYVSMLTILDDRDAVSEPSK